MTDLGFTSCDDVQSRLEEFALGELSGETGAAIADHLSHGCFPCNGRLQEIVAGFAMISHSLAPQLPPLDIERLLMQRLAGHRSVDDHIAPVPKAKTSNKSLTSGLIGAAIALAACLLGIAAWTVWRGGFVGASSHPAQSEEEYWANLRHRVDQADRAQHFPPAPRLEFAYLRSNVPVEPVHGYVVTDRLASQWHVYVFNLPPLPQDRIYQMWFVIGDAQYISAETFRTDAAGAAARVIDLPSDAASVTGIAISDEPTGGSPQPIGENFFRADMPEDEHGAARF